jgi:hypothetical protein
MKLSTMYGFVLHPHDVRICTTSCTPHLACDGQGLGVDYQGPIDPFSHNGRVIILVITED